MAEKKDKKLSNGDKLKCPYCGKPAVVSLTHQDPAYIHRIEKRQVRSAATGKMLDCMVLVDGCSHLGKMGSDHMNVEDCEF